jgi:DNA-binding response OmpR family regulator
MKTILLVDDELRMLDLLSLYLIPHHFICKIAASGKRAISIVKNENIDIIILDVMIPEMDGWTICQKIRELSNVPIIMLTARTDTTDIIKGLKYGADDYVTKPFHEEELLARIHALLRRTESQSNSTAIFFNDLKWDKDAMEITYQGQNILVTPKEFALIGLFLKHPHKVFSREHLLSLIWGDNSQTDDRTIDSHIRNIREKLRNSGFPIDQHLITVWGIGYKWVSDPANKHEQ